MRVRNTSSIIQSYKLFNTGGDYDHEADAPVGDTILPVPWHNPSDTFILQIAGYTYTKAIGDNPLCDPDPTDTPEPSDTPDPSETPDPTETSTPTPEPTDPPTPEPTDPPTGTTWQLDFETDAYGAALSAGTLIEDQWSGSTFLLATPNIILP
jgi:hypothetical protein